LGALGLWDEIRRLLESERFPLDPVVHRMYLARCNAQLGQDAASKNNWQRALESAAGDAGKLMTLANYAERTGALDIAETAYSQAAAIAPKLRYAWDGKLRMTSGSRDARQIHAVLAEMLKIWPDDRAVQNDEAYLRLLLMPQTGGDPAELKSLEALATELMQKQPASLPHRTLFALARLRQGRTDAGAAYSNIDTSRAAVSPGALAVHTAFLAANGQLEEARKELAMAPLDRLLAEERALLEQYVR
jgi:tetratricopeptide (TPR) repeat protein